MMRDDKRCDGRLRDLERRKPRFFRFCMYSHGLAFQSIPLNLCGWDVVTCCCWWKFRAMMFFRRDVVGKWRTKKRCMHVAETLPYAPVTCMSNQSDKPLPAMTTRNWDDKARVASPSTERREECHLQTTVPSELHLLPILRSHRSDRSNALTTWSTFTNEYRNTHTRTEQAEPSEPPEPSRVRQRARQTPTDDGTRSKKRNRKRENVSHQPLILAPGLPRPRPRPTAIHARRGRGHRGVLGRRGAEGVVGCQGLGGVGA